jgi:hypothetical protein
MASRTSVLKRSPRISQFAHDAHRVTRVGVVVLKACRRSPRRAAACSIRPAIGSPPPDCRRIAAFDAPRTMWANAETSRLRRYPHFGQSGTVEVSTRAERNVKIL